MDLVQQLRLRESFLTSKDVMELLALHRTTLCEWVRAGRIPAIRTGNGYRFDPRHLADWLAERTTAKRITRGAA